MKIIKYRERINIKKEKNREENLINEVELIYKNTNENSLSCRKRYRAAMMVFVKYLIREHKIQSLKNLQVFHITEYVRLRRTGENPHIKKASESTIILDVTAILYFLRKIGYLRYLHPLREVSYYLEE